MTLYEFLNTVNADYESVTPVGLIWTKDDVSNDEVVAAAGLPFAKVSEYGVEVRKKWQEAVTLSQIVQVTLFQEPYSDQRGVPRDKMQAVWDQVFNAPDYVNECPYGDEDFLKLEYVSGLFPSYDSDSGGLVSSIRFRLWFARRAKA